MTHFNKIHEVGLALKHCSPPIKLIKHSAPKESDLSLNLFKIADLLQQAADSGIESSCEEKTALIDTPTLTIQLPNRGQIHYMAIPDSREVNPFVEIFSTYVDKKDSLTKKEKLLLMSFQIPLSILVFISAGCPHCPQAVRVANLLALHNKCISVYIIDIQFFPELVKKYHIQSVPLTIVDNALFLNEIVPTTRLIDYIVTKEGAETMQTQFQSQISSGNFDIATEYLCYDSSRIHHFLIAWKTSSFTLRIGLLLISEKVLAHDKTIFHSIVLDLINILNTEDRALKGDTIDLLMRIGHPKAILPIQLLLKDSHPDIVEIALDALEELSR